MGLIVEAQVFLENSIERRGFLEAHMTVEDMLSGWLVSNICFDRR
jgi:hypothetical protein